MKRLAILISGLALILSVAPAYAAGKSMPKATGDYGYNVFALNRSANFVAQKLTTDTCVNSVNLTGNYVFSLFGGAYTHDINLVQTGNVLSGTGGYPAGGPYSIHETITGSVSGNTFTFTSTYSEFSYTYTVTGTVNPTDGTLTATGGTFAGSDWSISGNATVGVTGCDGRGTFNYSDENGTYYSVDVKYVAVSGKDAWFAGPVVSGNWGNYGSWLFVKVTDNGEPGVGVDVTAGDALLTEAQARLDVATHATPSISATITSGNIQVH